MLATSGDTRALFNKVPEVTAYFWIIKVLATTVGETFADFLNVNLGFGLNGTSLVMSAALALVLGVQFRTDRYKAGIYWLAVVLISVVGTLVTDNLVDNFGISLVTTTIVFAALLAATFALWYRVEGTLSIHSIFTPRREAFYWLSILFTFALGTAAGDLLAETLAVGYLWSAVLFATVIALITAAYYALGLNSVLAFWLAYIVTRPLGASTGDLLSQSVANGGLGFGAVATSALFLAIILGLVSYLAWSKADLMTSKA